MAEFILTPIARLIIDRLESAAVKQISSIWGVKDERHNNEVQHWLQRLSGSVHDADNLMDEINTRALQQRIMSPNIKTFFSGSNALAYRFKMSNRIKDIKKKLAKICDDRKFHLEEKHEETQIIRRARADTHSYVRQEEVIGREEDISAIISMLLSDRCEENVSMIFVCGIGGLGKTTLAKSVFNEERIQNHFELTMWVCVADNFDLKLILKSIIKVEGDMRMEELQKKLREVLGGKRYFLVLDDVWEENRAKWLELEELIRNGAKGSRVLVTTRSKKIANFTSSKGQLHKLGILNQDQSWTLFKRMAFKNGQEPQNSNIVKIGKEIVERCKGVPLAIRTTGNLLYNENLESKWSSLNKEFSKIPQASEEDIMPTLRLNYDHLPSHLRLCLAYCSLFPKDYKIKVGTLVKLWMAQGFLNLLNTVEDQCLEEVGYECFMNLVEGSFFQDVEVDEWGIITCCKMHDLMRDLMHDLAILVSGAKCATFPSNCQGNFINENTHHLSFEHHVHSVSKTFLVQASKARTILLLDECCFKGELDAVVLHFKLIRALSLKWLFDDSLDSICKLKHLRYLHILRVTIKLLPDSFTNLVNLQTLKFSNCPMLRELPRDIEKLINLRHLEIFHCIDLEYMPCGIGQLTNLQTLSTYVLRNKNKNKIHVPKYVGELKDLLRLNNLRGKLEGLNVSHAIEEYGSSSLKNKQYLKSLSLEWENTNVEIGEMSMDVLQPHPNLQELELTCYKGVKLSSWLSSLTNLVNLTVSYCQKCEYLVPLNQLHSLKFLKLKSLMSLDYISNNDLNQDLLGSTSTTTTTLLPSLQRLELDNLPNLKGWWKEVDHFSCTANEDKHISLPYFPCLFSLYIKDCPKLSCMPLYPHLEKELYLSHTSWKPLEDTLKMVIFPTTSSFSPLSKLKRLSLYGIEDLKCLPVEFKSLTTLNELTYFSCSKFKDLCPGILHLSSLRDLTVSISGNGDNDGDDDDDDGDQIMWKALTERIHKLALWSFSNLPKGIQHLKSLQRLYIRYCDSLTTIPEWIGNLKSLKELELRGCPNLTSFPEGIQGLTSLKYLEIAKCPNLTSFPEGIRIEASPL
ncbi:putative disease resistance protein RGA4 [Cannabis sativa]|uniref:putative disease resistance protein RGA4 n=1 Tax=Cannabis sativa TaxID=3483 RepID=UPI0029CA871F|nr:putative disease resistance protein RGA4 [Cannabis sativa]